MARKALTHRKNPGRTPSLHRRLNTSWVRHPVILPSHGRLRVLIYARFSTDEQDERSIEAQNEYCQHFLASLGVQQFDITNGKDEGISGEQLRRPGIDLVRDGIERKAWDLIVVEDSSRLFRDPTFCIELVRLAVQNGIR